MSIIFLNDAVKYTIIRYLSDVNDFTLLLWAIPGWRTAKLDHNGDFKSKRKFRLVLMGFSNKIF